jgi:hypothetical protein
MMKACAALGVPDVTINAEEPIPTMIAETQRAIRRLRDEGRHP